jgi:DNA modification methylase
MIRADARALPFATGSVQCVVTSPPYWGLRDYGTAAWVGGDADCDHGAAYQARRQAGRQTDVDGGTPGSLRDKPRTACKCGATRVDAQLGLEATPDAYVAGLVAVFRQVHRILRADGVCFLNLGDSYSGYHGNSRVPDDQAPSNKPGYVENMRATTVGVGGLKPKDLVGIPWRVAFALQADGWYLRSDIIWAKPNPMPESVTDRPTKSHEYVFLLTKAERYYWNAEAVREPNTCTVVDRAPVIINPKNADQGARRTMTAQGQILGRLNPAGRNLRSVWSIATQPYAGAHFATMPEKLVERCVLAGSKPGDVVLDPFLGSGTVARVATSLGRKGFGCELNREYLRLAQQRVHVTRGLPLEMGA